MVFTGSGEARRGTRAGVTEVTGDGATMNGNMTSAFVSASVSEWLEARESVSVAEGLRCVECDSDASPLAASSALISPSSSLESDEASSDSSPNPSSEL